MRRRRHETARLNGTYAVKKPLLSAGQTAVVGGLAAGAACAIAKTMS